MLHHAGKDLEAENFNKELFLRVNDENISGNWDFAHKLQLVFHDVFKQRSWIMEKLKPYFAIMKSMNNGKASTLFQEVAEDLEYIVLTNKTLQTTRFVRAFQRAITSALRNLPTLNCIIGKEYTTAGLNNNNARALELKTVLDNLMNAETLIYSIGLSQILELISEASLESQYSSHFPIQVKAFYSNYLPELIIDQFIKLFQVWNQIDLSKAKLEELATNWTWKTDFLKLADIGAPYFLVESILKNSSWTPILLLGALRKHKDKIKNYGELAKAYENGEIKVFHEKQEPLELGGMYIETFHLKIFGQILIIF